MAPKIVIVVDKKGVNTVRIVASSLNEQAKGENLLKSILEPLDEINRICQGKSEEDKVLNE